jgi:hypothetical protein
MATSVAPALPPGFQLETPVPAGTGAAPPLPPGFQLEAPATAPRAPQDGDVFTGTEVPEGFHAVTIDGQKVLRRNFGFDDAVQAISNLPGVGTMAQMGAGIWNTGVKALSGVAGAIRGGNPDTVRNVQEKMGVQLPPSQDPILQGFGKVADAFGTVAKPIDDAVASLPPGPRTVLESVAEAVPDVAGLAGARIPLKQAFAPPAPRVLGSAEIDEALHAVGYRNLPRQDKGSTMAQRVGATIVGEPTAAAAQSLTNQSVTNMLARREAGIADDVPELTHAAIAKARADGPGAVYDAARNALPEVLVQDQQLASSLRSIGDTTSQLPRSPDVDALKQSMLAQPQMTRDQLFANIQQARDRAARYYASDQPDAQAMADAYSDVARAYEDFAGRQLEANPQSPVTLQDWQNARVAFAKNYAAQAALRGTSIDAAVYSRALNKNPEAMTGGSRLIAEQHNRYPLSTRFGPTTFAPEGIGAAGSFEGGLARHAVAPVIGAGTGAMIGGPSGAAIGAGVGMMGSHALQSGVRRWIGGNPERAARVAAQASRDPNLSNFFWSGPEPRWPARPPQEPQIAGLSPARPPQEPQIAGLLPAPNMVNAGGGVTTLTTLVDELGLSPDVQAAGRLHPGAPRASAVVEPESRGPMETVEFREPENWSGLSFDTGAPPAAPGRPAGISLADVLAEGVEQSPPPGLTLGDMVAPKPQGVPFRRDPALDAGDLELAPEDAWFSHGQAPLGDLAAVMSQGVPEDIVARSSPRRPAMDRSQKRGKLVNNASGESSASVEAINRDKLERAEGKERYLIDPDGKMWPIRGVDAVDAKAPKGSIIVQKGIGDEPFSILDRGGLPASHARGLLNRALAGGTGLTLADLLGGS